MKKVFAAIWASIFLMSVGGVSLAADQGTPAEAEAMVKKAISYLKANGKDKAFAEVNNTKGQFNDRDLYVFVYDMNGKCLAHGFNSKMIGKDLREMKDADGKSYVKERIEIIKTKGKGWQDYKFTNPVSKKLENKTAYIEKGDDMIFGCGVYKP
jgi:signal transduction histidine kinase